MTRIYEYQGKKQLSDVGIPTPKGDVASTAQVAEAIAKTIGKPVAIKAQVWATGRFKAGGIKFAATQEEAHKMAQELLGSEIKGLKVEKVLVEEKLDVDREFYVGIIVNDSHKVKGPTLIFSTAGGVSIEETAVKNPEKVARIDIDYLKGVQPADADRLVGMLSTNNTLSKQIRTELSTIICNLYKAYVRCDARVAEINPLVLTKDNHLYAADCRITIDDNAVFRHPEFEILLPRDMSREPTELEKIAWGIEEGDYRGTAYFTQMVPKLEGTGWIGLHGIGGGGTMIAASALIAQGFKVANYADTSGDPPASKIYKVIKCIFAQPVDAYVLMGSCLANQEQWHHAHAIVKALREEADTRPGFPVIILLAGNKERETHEIIKNGLKDTSLRWALYGRDYIYQAGTIVDKVNELVAAYRKEKGV